MRINTCLMDCIQRICIAAIFSLRFKATACGLLTWRIYRAGSGP